MKNLYSSAMLIGLAMLTGSATAVAAESKVPEPFRGFDNASSYSINYDDLTGVLKAVVVDVGRTRAKVKRLTANEGNKF